VNKKTHTIMVVDDEAPNRLLMEVTLKESYDVVEAESGAHCLDLLGGHSVDLILLDVRMPDMNGYEVCKKIRSQHNTRNIPVIFLSANAMLDDVLKGYEAGGDDYITKPCELEEVLAKVKRNICVETDKKEAIGNARSMATLAITNTSEIGLIQQFYEKSFSCGNIPELSQEIINTCQAFGLSCCLQIKTDAEIFRMSSVSGGCTPLEIDVMELLIGEDRILHFGKRTAFNFEKITLLIKNMPLDDEEKCGRLNDHLASLLNGAEARILNIDVEYQQRTSIMLELRHTLNNVNVAMKNMEGGILNRENQTSNIIKLLLDKMSVGFSTLALTEEQERFFIDLVNGHMDLIIELYANDSQIEKDFHSVAKDIHGLISISE